jgi:hypothetical protein
MADNKKNISRTLYVERKRHQVSGGLTTIYETDLATNKTDPSLYDFTNTVNVGNFTTIFNTDSTVDYQSVKSTGSFIPSNSGKDCLINITVNANGEITGITITNGGEGYVVGDIFLIPGGIGGSLIINTVNPNTGAATGIGISTPGYGYLAATGVDFSDNFWTLQELDYNDTPVENTDVFPAVSNFDEWRLKLDKTNIQNHALFGSLSELIRSSIEGIVTKFPGSLWVVPNKTTDKYWNKLGNPFELDLFTNVATVPDPENIRYFQLNYGEYEIVETKYDNSDILCSKEKNKQNLLTDCKYNITSVTPTYRYVYVRRPGTFPNTFQVKNPNTGSLITFNNPTDKIYKSNATPPLNTTAPVPSNSDHQHFYSNAYHEPIKLLDYITIQGSKIGGTDIIDIEGDGFGAKAQASINSSGVITGITITNGGSEYTNATVTIKGTGTGASASASVVNGVVTGITNLVGGTGYGCATSVTINIDYIYRDLDLDYCNLIDVLATAIGVTNSNPEYPSFPSISYHIKPKEKYLNEFYDNLNDFQSALLTRDTFPKYTSRFKIPVSDEYGKYYDDLIYTWTCSDGYNLDITTVGYLEFIQRMNEIGELCDNIRCDVVYRLLTHDSIKNFDTSHERLEDEAKLDAYLLGGTKFAKVLRIYGREYDEIRKYISSISLINNLTYDQADNYPDGFLKTNVEYEGWKSTSIAKEKNPAEKTDRLYYGNTKEYSLFDVEREFYRRLLINSPHIARWKGTKHGIEMIMNLFGIPRETWDINEYVYLAQGNNFYEEETCTDKTPYFKTNLSPVRETIASGKILPQYKYWVISTNLNDYITYNDNVIYAGRSFYGEVDDVGDPITTFTKQGNPSVILNEVENLGIVNDKKTYNIDGDIYYQNPLFVTDEYNNTILNSDMYLIPFDICVDTFIYNETPITCPICNGSGSLPYGQCPVCHGIGNLRDYVAIPGFNKNRNTDIYYQQMGGWYQETYSNVLFVNNISQMYSLIMNPNVIEGTVVYVREIDTTPSAVTNPSTYWVLIDNTKITQHDGWKNLTIAETETPITVATVHSGNIDIDIQAYSNIITTTEGNNPHTGYGNYDGGLSYIKHIGANINRIPLTHGSGAKGEVRVDTNGRVISISMKSKGSGYTQGNVVAIIKGDGTGAAVSTPVVSNGGITSIAIAQQGSGYTWAIVDIIDNSSESITDINADNENTMGLYKYTIDRADNCVKPYPQYKNLLNKGFCITEVLDTKKSWGVYGNDNLSNIDKFTLIDNQQPG